MSEGCYCGLRHTYARESIHKKQGTCAEIWCKTGSRGPSRSIALELVGDTENLPGKFFPGPKPAILSPKCSMLVSQGTPGTSQS